MIPLSTTPAPLLRIAYVLALLALAQPLLAVLNPEVNAWRPDHAHVQLAGGAVAPHAHPYDAAGAAHEASTSSTGATSSDVGFTAPDFDATSAVLPAPAALVIPEALPGMPLLELGLPAEPPLEALSPPPRP